MNNDNQLTVALTDDVDESVFDDTDSPADLGEESISGSSPSVTSDDDVGEAMAQITGTEPEQGKPFSLADEIEKEEYDRRGISQKDMETDD
jgi:hypothetical protein